MTIKEGDKIPNVQLKVMTEKGVGDISTEEIFSNKKVVLFSVPGAFTPTCSAQHLPGFIDHADQIKDKSVDTIICISVNDAFVMDAWGKDRGAGVSCVSTSAAGMCSVARSPSVICATPRSQP